MTAGLPLFLVDDCKCVVGKAFPGGNLPEFYKNIGKAWKRHLFLARRAVFARRREELGGPFATFQEMYFAVHLNGKHIIAPLWSLLND